VEQIHELLPFIAYRDGRLSIDGVTGERLWDGQRSLLLHVPSRAVDNYRSIRDAFAAHFPVSVSCALKACYVGPVLSALRDAGAGAEIAGELEWRLARSVGFAAGRTVAAGMCRQPEHLQALLSEDSLLIAIDSMEELQHLEWHARRAGARPKVMVRVNPLPPDSFFSERSKLGVELDAAYDLLERVARCTQVQLHGLQAHQLVRCTDPARFGELARRMGELRAELTGRTGGRPKTLDLGGGIEARYLLERAGQTVADFALAAREALAGAGDVELLLEPGRYVFGDAAVVLSRIQGTKLKEGQHWHIAEVGSNLLPPTSDRAYPPLPLRITEGVPWRRTNIADPTPTPARLYLDATLPADAADVGIALLGTGAYTAVRASLWSAGLPDIGYVKDGVVRLLFDRQAQDAAFRALYGVELEPMGSELTELQAGAAGPRGARRACH
jgi:diaminopimelate decarboxylase